MAAAKKKEKITFESALNMVECKKDDVIFVHIYETSDTNEYVVSDIPDKLLKKSVKLIRPNYGGTDKNYSCYLFILDK